MNQGLAITVGCALVAIAGLHVYWGLGGFWPGHDAASLVDMVVGARPGTPVPPLWACLFVAICLLLPAVSSWMIAYRATSAMPTLLAWIPAAALWFSALVFLARGLSTYLSPLVLSARGTAFYELDRMLYAPLCLGLAAGLVTVWLTRPKAQPIPKVPL